MDTMAFKNFDEIDMNHLASIEGGFDIKGVAASYLAVGTAALGGISVHYSCRCCLIFRCRSLCKCCSYLLWR